MSKPTPVPLPKPQPPRLPPELVRSLEQSRRLREAQEKLGRLRGDVRR